MIMLPDSHRPSVVSSSLMAVSAVIACALLTFATPLHATHTIFATLFIPAVLASAWYGGAKWGLLATAFSSTFLLYFVLEPVHSFKIDTGEDIARICAFVLVGVCLSFGVALERRIRNNSVENAERLRTTLQSIGDAVIVTDVDGRITMVNAVAEQLTGWAGDAVGTHLSAVFHVIDETELKETQQEAKKAAPVPFVIRVPERSVLLARDGSEHPIQANVALIKDAATVFGMVVVFRDVTAQRQRQRETEETARRLREIAEQREQLLNREQAARNAAVEANQMKDEFLATVSHELRTPLTSIIGWSSVARSQPSKPETLNKALATIERNAKLQLQLVEDLLDVSRISAGTFRMEKEAVNIAGILTVVVENLRVALSEKEIALTLNAQPCPPLWVDPNRVQQVFSNLLSNSIKFTQSNGHIGIDLKTDGRTVEIRITDDGQGFGPEFQSKMFRRFQQANRGRGKHGLGLGLAITRHIVEMHGGKITGYSGGVNKGATFVVNLPIQPDAATSHCA